jgi:hypothetical protein
MTTTREEEIDWQHVAKHGLAKVTPEHTWAEWLADRNAEIERLEAEITRLRSTSQAGCPAGWKLVPVEPTHEMQVHGVLTFGETSAAADPDARYEVSRMYANMLSASPPPPSTNDGALATLDQTSNAALLTLSKVWQLDGDWMKCRACDRPLIASRDGEPLSHRAGCKNSAHVHPWAELRSALASSPTPAATEEGLVQANAEPVASDGSVTGPVCQWQPIETAPKDGTWVLGFRPTSFREDQIDTWQFVHRSCDPPIWINSADSNDEDEQPTHWMPLPLPPDDRTNGSEAQSGSLNQALPASSVSATDAVEAERRLREALAPLAAFATFMDKDAPDEAYLPATVPHISLTLGQARAAATLLGFPHASDDPQFNGERLAAIRSRGTDGGTNG